MGQTRVRKSKKAVSSADDAPEIVSEKIDKLSLSTIPATTTILTPHKSNSSYISEEDLQTDQKILSADPKWLDIRNTDDKGVAVFAACKIPAGTLVLAETPLIRLTQAEEDADKAGTSKDEASVLERQFYSHAKSTQKSYLSLFDSQKSDFSKVKSIYYSNCYNLSGRNKPSKSSLGGSCIGITASRINHSCLPNVQFSFDEDQNRMLFHAIKAIPKNRELVSNYDSIYELRSQRQRRQMLYYAFKCDCEACEPGQSEFWARSDERRKAMIDARREVKHYERMFEEQGELNATQDPISHLEKLEGLLIKEGILALPLADVYRSLAKWAERMGNRRHETKWRAKERDVCVTCLGRYSVRVQELSAKLDQAHVQVS